MPFLRVKDQPIYYEFDGAGADVLLIHGAGQDTLSWRYVAPELAKHFRVWLVDLPGHGKSWLPVSGPVASLDEYADFVLDFVDAAGLDSVTLVGHSMSAGIALIAALNRPVAVRGVVSVDGGGETNRTHGGNLLELVDVNPVDYFEENFRRICSPSTPARRIEEIAWDVTRCSEAVVYSDIRAYSVLSVDNRVSAIRCPVGFIHGADDWSIPPAIAEETSRRLGREAPVVLLEHTGHFPHVENPEAFVPALLSELARQQAL